MNRTIFTVTLLCALSTAHSSDKLLEIANQTFPGYTVRIKDYSYHDFDLLIEELLTEQPSQRNFQNRIDRAQLTINELEQTFVPRINFGLNQQNLDFRKRLVSIHTRVPVEWDNANPQQIDIKLPNGGHGLLWLPKPTKYEWRDIDIHGSRPYKGHSFGFTTGVQYNYHSGIALELLNLNVYKRLDPETYGYDWFSSIDNTVSIPLLKIFNSNLSPRETDIKNIEHEIENLKISAELNKSREKHRIRSMLLGLYLAWQRYDFYQEMINLTREQIAEVDVLSEKSHLTVLEEIAIGSELQSYLSTENIVFYEILSYASALKSEGDLLFIYRLEDVDIEAEIETIERKTAEFLDLKNLNQVLSESPQLRIMKNNLKSTKANLALYRPANIFQLDLVGSVSMLTSSDLGYKYPAEAVRMAFTNPDGLSTSVGLQFSMPLSFKESDFRYRTAVKDYQIAAEDLIASRADFKKHYLDMRINLLNLKENLRAAEANLEFAKNRFEISNEFFKIDRITAFEFNSYRKEKIQKEFAQKEAHINYYTALAEFLSLMDLSSDVRNRQ